MRSKIFNDPVHGHVEIHPLCVKIMDTPQFQRLRDIRQLGGVYFVFPGASHNRFEHSLGVCHLSNLMLLQLKTCDEHLAENEKITDADALCVQVAGLCHDLGHGVWSHMFDRNFIPRAKEPATRGWEHEHASVAMLEAALQEEDGALQTEFEKWGLRDIDVHFIKELIYGCPAEAPSGFKWKGRGAKHYLYEIISNKRNGVDVDKFDYFARDCHHLGINKSFDALRLMRLARVYRGEGEVLRVCYPNKEAWNVYELFHTRYNLHKRAYQHRVTNAVELMVTDALLAAKSHLYFPTGAGEELSLAASVQDMRAYIQVNDHILSRIEFSTSPDLKVAREILHRLRKRSLYKMAREILLPPRIYDKLILNGSAATSFLVREGKLGVALDNDSQDKKTADQTALGYFDLSDFHISAVNINYGLGSRNPVQQVCFYSTKETDDNNLPIVGEMPQDCVSWFIPREFQETYLRLYVRSNEKIPYINEAFRKWCASAALRQEPPLTPTRPSSLKRSQTEPPVGLRSTNLKRKLTGGMI